MADRSTYYGRGYSVQLERNRRLVVNRGATLDSPKVRMNHFCSALDSHSTETASGLALAIFDKADLMRCEIERGFVRNLRSREECFHVYTLTNNYCLCKKKVKSKDTF
jgi:hypothetical protein